ncbi:cortactin-binding protein 2-like isoform X6 [Eriocheir sinensis]|uniref:cortactin-binding protein 2-like isoform X6 n=1 Tax=Eriocheir sinensis TaxID=95602 RepID=UPI0021C979A7|nr:cortactin-binding protein 2-like isoform X6 [Eriocheir sinensis]
MASSSPHPDTHQDTPPDFTPVVSSTSSTSTSPSPPAVTMAGATAASPQKSSHQQGQPFEPLDKAASQTVKLNPKLELSRNDLLRLLSYMEGELQSRDVVIATLKTERVKNLLQYGRVGLSDPFLALQRDSIGGSVVRGGGVNEAELRALEETQLAQLEHLIAQQRKAHQRMRHVLREAEKRHSRVVAELEEERRKHEHDTAQGDDVTYALEKDRTRLKQPELRILKELEAEKAAKKKVEKELRKVQETLEEERGRQKQIILMLVEERKRLALQYVEERKRSEDLAQILSEEKGRIDSMAEGLEEESKKSLQMEAELEKQLADFDTERQQMRGQLTKKEERISELEALLEKQQREVDHYKKQLQEAHNVAMFQQTLSVSPPRIGIATRPAPPQLPAKPATLTQPQPRMPGALTPPKITPRVRASSPGLDEVTGVPLNMGLSVAPHHVSSGPGATNPSHSVPPGVAAMSSVTKAVQLTATVNSVPVAGPTTGIARGVQPGVGLRPVMYSVSTSEVTRTVTTAAKSYSVSENEAGWTGGSEGEVPGSLAGGVPGAVERGVVRVTGPAGEARSQAQVVQVTPRVNVSASPGTKVITTTHGGKVTFHVTTNAPTTTAAPAPPASNGQQQQTLTQTSTMIKKPPPPTRSTQPGGPPPPVPLNKPTAAPPVPPNKPAVPPKKDLVTRVGAGGQGVSVEPGSSDVAVPAISNLTSPSNPSSAPNTHVVCSSPSQSPCASLPSVSPSGPSSTHLPSLSPLPHHSISLNTDHEGHASLSSPIAIPLSSPPPLPAYSSLSSPSSVAAASVSLSQSLLYPPLHSPLPASPASRLSESTPQSSASLGATPWMPSSLSPSSTIINTPTATTTTNTTTTLNYHHHSPIATSITSNTVTTSSTTTTTTSSLSGSLPPPLPLGDCPVVLTPMEGEDLEPPHSPLDVSTPLTMDGMTALHIAAQGNNWQSVPVLVRCGGSVSAEDDEGRTPAYLALLYACTPAAAALLAFPQSLEHTTKDGCNYLHAAIKSAEAECVEVLLQHILATDDGPHLLHWLASGPDHRGSTPLALAVAHPTADLLAALCHAGLDLPALLSHDPSLLKLASPACHALFSTSSQSESTCSVWLEGLDLDRVTNGDGGCSHKQEDEFESGSGSSSSNEYRERWPIGAVRVTTTTLWAVLEEALTSLALHHLDTLARSHGPSSVSMGGRHSSGSGSRGERRRSDPLQELEVNSPHLGITKAAISHFSIGHHRWTRGEYGLVSGPCDLLANTGSQDICIHLRTFEAAAYSLLVPVPVLKNYLRLMEQSQCVVVYGPRDSGKCSLVRCLAHLKGSGSGVGVTRIDLARGRAASLESVRGVAESGGNLVLEHVSREAWPAVWAMMQGISGGTVLVTMDAWRRPGGGQLEGGVLWVQLRHDREPLVSTLSRSLMRLLASQHSGVLPSPASHTQRIVEWVTAAWSRLAATLMSLGFSSALHGPHLFTQALCGAVSPRDILRGVKHLWNSVISSEIRTEVVSVWRRSSVGGEVDEARVTSMALYVVIQRSLAPGLPLPPPQAHDFLASLDGGLGRSAFRGIKSSVPSSRPKDLPLDVIGSPLWTGSSQQVAEIPQQSGPPVGLSSPTSPEWDEANLTKILGLSPMGYT